MGLAIAIGMALVGLALVSVLMWGLWRVRTPSFGSRVRTGRSRSVDRNTGEWVDEYPLRRGNK